MVSRESGWGAWVWVRLSPKLSIALHLQRNQEFPHMKHRLSLAGEIFRGRKTPLDTEARQLTFAPPTGTGIELSCLSSLPKVTHSLFSSLWMGCQGMHACHSPLRRGEEGVAILFCSTNHTSNALYTHTTYGQMRSL